MLGISVCRGIIRQSLLGRAAFSSLSSVRRHSLHTAPACRAAGGREAAGSATFDPSVLEFVVCPLSRKALRFAESTNELINDELGIAYPIVDGIPNLIPQDARRIHIEQKSKESDQAPQ